MKETNNRLKVAFSCCLDLFRSIHSILLYSTPPPFFFFFFFLVLRIHVLDRLISDCLGRCRVSIYLIKTIFQAKISASPKDSGWIEKNLFEPIMDAVAQLSGAVVLGSNPPLESAAHGMISQWWFWDRTSFEYSVVGGHAQAEEDGP
jgi:hypothetical protein